MHAGPFNTSNDPNSPLTVQDHPSFRPPVRVELVFKILSPLIQPFLAQLSSPICLKMSIFGQSTASPFGASQQQQQQPSNAFGSSNNASVFGAQPKPLIASPFASLPHNNIFGSLGSSPTVAQPLKPTTSLFGSTQTQQQGGGILGLGQQQQQPQQSSIFGGSTQQQQPQQSGLFGSLNQQQQPPPQQSGTSSLFGNLGGTANQSQQQPSSLLSGPLFQSVNQNSQQQQGQQQGSVTSQPQTKLWQPTESLSRR